MFCGSRCSWRAAKCRPTALERQALARVTMRRLARTRSVRARMFAGVRITRRRPVLRRRVSARGLEARSAARGGPGFFARPRRLRSSRSACAVLRSAGTRARRWQELFAAIRPMSGAVSLRGALRQSRARLCSPPALRSPGNIPSTSGYVSLDIDTCARNVVSRTFHPRLRSESTSRYVLMSISSRAGSHR